MKMKKKMNIIKQFFKEEDNSLLFILVNYTKDWENTIVDNKEEKYHIQNQIKLKRLILQKILN